MTATFSLLVVDDEPDLRTLYELTLLREGYDVDSAGSVEEAWGRLTERHYSAVITDMRLPDGNGLDLLRRLEGARRGEKAIVITAYGSAENAVEALKAGAFDYLTKSGPWWRLRWGAVRRCPWRRPPRHPWAPAARPADARRPPMVLALRPRRQAPRLPNRPPCNTWHCGAWRGSPVPCSRSGCSSSVWPVAWHR